jgi:type I restriction enzyme S subunit
MTSAALARARRTPRSTFLRSKRSICLPPLAEQRRIVAKLDALTARTARARADLDRIPALATRYKQAVLAKAFSGELTAEWRLKNGASWPTERRPLASLCAPKSPICYGVVQPGSVSHGGIPLVRVCDLVGGRVDWPEVRTIDPDIDGEYSRSRIKNGDVLVTVVGTIGRVALVADAPGSVNIARAVARVRPDATVVLGSYVFLALSAPEVQEELLSESREVARKTLNLEQLREIAIPVPSLEEQAQVVRVVTTALAEIDRLVAEAAAARRLLDRLDQAVLAKAFRGELVHQNPADEPANVLLERIRAEQAEAPKTARGRRKAVA